MREPTVIGPHISAVTASGDEMTLKLTFHRTGTFVAHVVSMPPTKLVGLTRVGGRSIALGHHAKGTAEVKVILGHLKVGRYALVVLPRPEAVGTSKGTLASWVYFTVAGHGAIPRIKLENP